MLLTVDRGNSTLDVMLHGGAASRRARLPTEASVGPFLDGVVPQRCVAATVVPGGLAAFEVEMRALGVVVQQAGRELCSPLSLDYEPPSALGVDRWLGALAAYRRFGRAVVVDCGSATTVNLVEADGTFRGGAIAPGLPALLRGMQVVTPHLPAAALHATGPLPARSPAASVQLGVHLAFCGAIERLVADVLRVARGPATVVLTGGHAEDYLRHGRLQPHRLDDLVHQGLAILAHESACGS